MIANTRRLARALGWFSLGLAAAELAMTRSLSRLIGIRSTPRSRAIMRGAGSRELLAGAGILSGYASRAWLWSRAIGDVMDLALLGSALRRRRTVRGRV